MIKIVIIGSSIAGTSLASLLSSHAKVVVFDLKSKEDIGAKLCSNICTDAIRPILKRWGFDFEKYVKNYYSKLKIFTKEKSIEFPIKEFSINREKLIGDLIADAKDKGAKFVFNSKFVDVEKRRDGKIDVITEKNGKMTVTRADYVIGADGAVSEFARKIGLWQGRKHLLYLQGHVQKDAIKKKFVPKENEQYVFLGDDFGYYSYVYSIDKGLNIGLGDEAGRKVKRKYDSFVKFLGGNSRKIKIKGALIPLPRMIGMKNKMFVIGDAGCHTKFSLGGIIPSMMAAEAIKDIIVNDSYKKYSTLQSRMFLHQMASKVLRKLSAKDYEELFEIMKESKYKRLLAARDKFGWKEVGILMSPKLFWFSLKALFKM